MSAVLPASTWRPGMLLGCLLVSLLAWFPTAGVLAGEALRIDPAAERIALSAYVERIEDPEGRLTLADVLAPERPQQFTPGSPGIGFSASAWWLRISLRHDGTVPLSRWLDTGDQRTQEIDLYLQDAQGKWQHQSSGSRQAYAARPLPLRTFVFPVVIPAEFHGELYLRVRSLGANNAALIPTLWQAHSLQAVCDWENSLLIMLMGMGGALAVVLEIAFTLPQTASAAALAQVAYQTGMAAWAPILPLLAGMVTVRAWQGDRSARFLVIAHLPLLAAMVNGAWRIQISNLEPHFVGTLAALSFELFVMALAVADRYEQLRRQKAAAKAETIATLQRSERELETKVEQRTAQLTDSETKVRELLHNILPASVAVDLAEHGRAQPVELKSATILFTDFSDFTQAASTMPAERMVAELNDIFSAFDDICRTHGIEKIKTIGDAYMAAAGVPVPCADHAQRAVKVGLAMCAFLAERNQTAAFKWKLRVGIHSGPVVAGAVGKHKYAFDVWGDTVNIASRMESSGEVGKVNVSAYAYDLIRNDFACDYRGKQTAKGKGEMDMYFVSGTAA